jgi:predicted CoA-binding protein
MKKLSKTFLDGKELLVIGYSGRNEVFCKSVVQTLTKCVFTVFPMNTRKDSRFDVKVYSDFSQLPKIPSQAYVLLNRANSGKLVDQLKEKGIKKILFQSMNNVDADTLEKCGRLGIQAAVGCPLMIYGAWFHRLHGLFAGVR